MSFSIRTIRTRFSPRSGRCAGSRGFSPAAVPGSGLYRSTDGGNTWQQLQGHGLPEGILGRIGVTVSGADSDRVYAIIEAKEGGIFQLRRRRRQLDEDQ